MPGSRYRPVDTDVLAQPLLQADLQTVVVRVLTVLNRIGIAVVFRGGHDGDAAAWVIVDSDIKAAVTAEDEVRAMAALLLDRAAGV
jgi:hypothetical protein